MAVGHDGILHHDPLGRWEDGFIPVGYPATIEGVPDVALFEPTPILQTQRSPLELPETEYVALERTITRIPMGGHIERYGSAADY